MAAILKKAIFVHISKTGGTWLLEALKNSITINNNFLLRGIYKHCTLREMLDKFPNTNNKSTFAFVRNPVTWYQSRWACNYHRKFFLNPPTPQVVAVEKWERKPSGIKMLCRATCIRKEGEFKNFNVWMRRIANDSPGFLTQHYQHYLGRNYARLNRIGKMENLLEDTVNILNEFREPFDEMSLKGTSIINESRKNLNRFWDEQLLSKVIKNEYDFMSRFGYSTDVSHYHHLCL